MTIIAVPARLVTRARFFDLQPRLQVTPDQLGQFLDFGPECRDELSPLLRGEGLFG